MTDRSYWLEAWDIHPFANDQQAPISKNFKEAEWLSELPKSIGSEVMGPKIVEIFSREYSYCAFDEKEMFPKTFHVIGSLSAGGAERQLVNLLVGLADKGHKEQTLMTIYPLEGSAGHYAPYLREHRINLLVKSNPVLSEGVELIRDNYEMVQAIKSIPYSINAYILDLWVEFTLHKPKVVHCWLDHGNIWGGIAAVLAGVPRVILSTRNVNPSNFPYLYSEYMGPWYKWLMASPRLRMLNNSSPGADSYAQWLDYDRSKIDVVLNGVNLSHLKPATAEERAKIRKELNIPQDAIVVVGAFRLSEEKRPELFVETFAKARKNHPNIYGVLMGEGPYIDQVNAAIKKHKLEDCFFAIGRRTDLPIVMTSMDVFLHTAFWEGTPNVVLEAQQMGLPVVVTDSGGTIHAVDNGVTGLMVEKNDTQGLAKALDEVISNIDTWKQRAKNSHEFVAKKFGIARMVDETLAIQKGQSLSSLELGFFGKIAAKLKALFS